MAETHDLGGKVAFPVAQARQKDSLFKQNTELLLYLSTMPQVPRVPYNKLIQFDNKITVDLLH